MRPHQDAYGHELYDCLTGESSTEIVERDDGFIQAGTATQYFLEYPRWPRHQRQAIRYATGKVLDVGCGAGRHSLHLQNRGFDVLGIDISPIAIEVCKLRGLKNTAVVSLRGISATMGRFDTILMMGNNFGLFGNRDATGLLLRRFHNITNAGARLIVETLDPYQTNTPEHLEYHERNRTRGRMAGQIRLRVRYGRYATPWFDYLFVSKHEMEDLLDGTGWKVLRYVQSDGPTYCAVIGRTKGP